MERLTKRDTDGQAIMDCEKCKADWTEKHGESMEDCTALYCRNRLKERVAAYEDTRLTPQEVISMHGEWRAMMSVLNSIGGGYTRLRELAEADKDGRVAVLPVKPVLTPILSSMLYIIEDGDIYEDALYEAVVGMSGNGEMNVVYTTLSDQITFEQADIGKTVFLASEEAEKALEGKRNA